MHNCCTAASLDLKARRTPPDAFICLENVSVLIAWWLPTGAEVEYTYAKLSHVSVHFPRDSTRL